MNIKRFLFLTVVTGFLLGSLPARSYSISLDPAAQISGPVYNDTKGVWTFTVSSPYQSASNVVEVLLPADYSPDKVYQVVYVLPVEPGTGTHFGDGLQVIKATGHHDNYDVICVQPTFDTFPWYGDHSGDPAIRHESYMNQVIVPMIALSRGGNGSETNLLAADFEQIPQPEVLNAPKLSDAADAGHWVLTDPRRTELSATADASDTALLLRGHSRAYSLRAILTAPFVVGRAGSLRFDVATKAGYGTLTSGYGRDRDSFIIGKDEKGNELFRLMILTLNDQGRLGYVLPDGQEVWLGDSTNNIPRNNSLIYDTSLMRTVRVDFKPDGMDLSLQGVPLASDVPYNSQGKRLCGLVFEGESIYAEIFIDNISLTTETGFQAWQKIHWPSQTDPDVIGPTAIPMGDGITNLEKYAMGMSPFVSERPQVTSVIDEDGFLGLKFTISGAAIDVTYHVDATADLKNWEPIWSDRNPLMGGDASLTTRIITDSVHITESPEGRRFLRLRIDHP